MQKQNEVTSQNESTQFFRFQVFQGDMDSQGQIRKEKSVGMAYLKDGQQTFTIRLWMFLNERFYMIQNRNDSTRYLVMTREPNKNVNAKNKYYWNIVGNGVIDTVQGVIQINFDLLEKSVYINVHPEPSAFSVHLPDPVALEEAA